jgi:16S rRNA (adenine1518-N6/adenine1519-N6)-dimethyltransferase
MTLTEIRTALAEIGTAPTRSLGQNFLHDQNLAQWIVRQLDIREGDHIVEIGPGLGALSEYLAEAGVPVTLIEKDGRLAGYLKERFRGGTVEVFHEDALNFDLRNLWGRGHVKVVGNLPYYVSTPLIAKFTNALSPASMLVLTLQHELAERLDARRGTKDYGAMTVCVGRHWNVQYLRKLPPNVFHPAPKVASAVISLDKKDISRIPALDETVFDEMVRRGFSERRKQLRNLLPELRGRWPELTAALDVPETVRAEELDLQKWETLVRLVAGKDAQSGNELFDIVDERDAVIGAKPRAEVHVNNLRHRAVHMLILNDAGEVLLQKRSMWKDKNPGKWDSSAAGHVDSGEGYEEAAARELREELGIDAPLTRIGKLGACEQTGEEFIEIFAGRHSGPVRAAALEVDATAYFPVGRIADWIARNPEDFSPVFPMVFRALSGAGKDLT